MSLQRNIKLLFMACVILANVGFSLNPVCKGLQKHSKLAAIN